MSQSDSHSASPAASASGEDARLNPRRMSVYGMGDFTINAVLVALNMFYVTYFLTQVAGLRPELAGLVQLIGRGVDAFTDPAMGRISDLCHWKWGRRRPFFMLGALPFGLTFALLWTTPGGSQTGMFVYYTALYILLSLSMTVLAVPYLALMPEMALGYDARTSLNMYRNVGSDDRHRRGGGLPARRREPSAAARAGFAAGRRRCTACWWLCRGSLVYAVVVGARGLCQSRRVLG